MFRPTAQLCARIVGFCAPVVLIGCLPVDPSADPSWPEEVLSSSPTPPTGSVTPETPTAQTATPAPAVSTTPSPPFSTRHVEVEPNDDWEQAEPLSFGGSIELAGTMSAGAGIKDVDVFDLGAVAAGQRLLADLSVSGGTDVQLGLFDGSGRLLAYVDPVSPTAGPDSVDIVLHEGADPLLVMVATRSSSTGTRSYSAHVRVEASSAVSANPQTIVLVFQGASQVRIGSRPPVDVPVFDIAAVNPEFAGLTAAAIDLLLQKVREDYEGLNVSFYADGDPNIPPGDVTSIYFGTSDTRLLGLADNIDPYNQLPRQSAIIYTDTFSLFNQLHPGFEGTVQVLANVASHEAGHLLGLRHAADPEELMDVTATARQMLMDQWFKSSSPLHSSVLPLGLQDAPAMLSWGVGGSLKPQTTFKLYARARAIVPGTAEQDFYIPRSLLADCGCVACDHAEPAGR